MSHIPRQVDYKKRFEPLKYNVDLPVWFKAATRESKFNYFGSDEDGLHSLFVAASETSVTPRASSACYSSPARVIRSPDLAFCVNADSRRVAQQPPCGVYFVLLSREG